jgi:hypothetical protein
MNHVFQVVYPLNIVLVTVFPLSAACGISISVIPLWAPKLTALFGAGMGHPGMGYPLSMGPSSVPPSIISGATTVRRARSVAEISHHGLAYSQPPTPGKKIYRNFSLQKYRLQELLFQDFF